MSSEEGNPRSTTDWVLSEELKLPEVLNSERVQSLHSTIDKEWCYLQTSACQTAAARALWNHAVHDPLAATLAGESYLRSTYEKMRNDHLNNAKEVSGVIIAIRTLWFDSRLEDAINSSTDITTQVVLLGAGMDTRAYRLNCLKESIVFEVDFPELLQMKSVLIDEAIASPEHQQIGIKASSLIKVPADIREPDWLEKLQSCGFVPERKTVWVLEGILYYLSHLQAMQVLRMIATGSCTANTTILADFMNESSTSLSNSKFKFFSDWPEHLLPTLGFCHVKLSQIGDPDCHFGLLQDPQNLFAKLRNLPRSLQTHPEDGTPCRRLYLVEATGYPNHDEK